MGSGFNFLLNAINVSPAALGWRDVDVSAHVPLGSTGVLLDICNSAAVAEHWADVRKNGSADDDYANGRLTIRTHRYAIVPLDVNRIFEAQIDHVAVQIWLIGYCDTSVVFLDPRVDKSAAALGWQDVDCSAEVSADATGIIVKFITTLAAQEQIRMKGSADDRAMPGVINNSWKFCTIGVNALKLAEQKVDDLAADLYLIGYVKPPITFFMNSIDISIAALLAWTDDDLTAVTEPSADGAIIDMYHGGAGDRMNLRKNGSGDSRTDTFVYDDEFGYVGLDLGNIFEGYIQNADNDFFLVGYTKPLVAPPKPKGTIAMHAKLAGII